MARNLQSHSFTKKRRAKFYWTLALIIIVIISWLCALSFLFRLNTFTITVVKVFGADADITPALQSATEKTLVGDYFGLFAHSSTLIYPKTGIIAAVKASSPRIDRVTVNRDGLHGLVISVSEKIPAAVICATLPDFSGNQLILDQTDGCYFVDESGLLFGTAPSFSTSSATLTRNVYYAPNISGAGSSNNLSGSYATSSMEWKGLQAFYDGARTIGISPAGLLIKEGGEYELYASTTVIYFNDARSMSLQLANLRDFWMSMTATARSKNQSVIFDYIDLRYGSNVFYKVLK
jgi:hypothetical protein